jgi:hypothetical protein
MRGVSAKPGPSNQLVAAKPPLNLRGFGVLPRAAWSIFLWEPIREKLCIADDAGRRACGRSTPGALHNRCIARRQHAPTGFRLGAFARTVRAHGGFALRSPHAGGRQASRPRRGVRARWRLPCCCSTTAAAAPGNSSPTKAPRHKSRSVQNRSRADTIRACLLRKPPWRHVCDGVTARPRFAAPRHAIAPKWLKSGCAVLPHSSRARRHEGHRAQSTLFPRAVPAGSHGRPSPVAAPRSSLPARRATGWQAGAFGIRSCRCPLGPRAMVDNSNPRTGNYHRGRMRLQLGSMRLRISASSSRLR